VIGVPDATWVEAVKAIVVLKAARTLRQRSSRRSAGSGLPGTRFRAPSTLSRPCQNRYREINKRELSGYAKLLRQHGATRLEPRSDALSRFDHSPALFEARPGPAQAVAEVF